MKTVLLLAALLCSFASCSIPVLRGDLLDQGVREVSMAQLAQNPQLYKGKLFILGGAIVSVTLTEAGSLIEVLYIPVDSAGHLKQWQPTAERYLAFFPKELGVLDPVLYRFGRMVTLAGEYTDARPGRIGEMEYTFPYFVIRQIYLWKEGETERDLPGRFSIGLGVGGSW